MVQNQNKTTGESNQICHEPCSTAISFPPVFFNSLWLFMGNCLKLDTGCPLALCVETTIDGAFRTPFAHRYWQRNTIHQIRLTNSQSIPKQDAHEQRFSGNFWHCRDIKEA